MFKNNYKQEWRQNLLTYRTAEISILSLLNLKAIFKFNLLFFSFFPLSPIRVRSFFID